MPWDTGSPVSNTPTKYIIDRIKNNIGIGSAPIRNWSFVESVPTGNGTNETMQLVLSNWGAGDSFKVTFNGNESAAVSYAVDISATLQAAIRALADFNNANTYVNVTKVDVNTYNIIGASGSKWYFGGGPFSVVGTFTCTSAVGCSGVFTQTVAPVGATGSGTYSHQVFKCAGSGNDANDAGQDFYVVFLQDESATATVLNFALFVEWSTAYHKGRKPAPAQAASGSNAYLGVDADGWPVGTMDPTHWYGAGGTYVAGVAHTLNKTGFTYQIKMTKNFIALGERVGTTDRWIYMGLMDSLVLGVTDTYPIVMIGYPSPTQAVNNTGAVVNITTAPGSRAGAVVNIFGLIPTAWTAAAAGGATNATNAFDLYANSGIWVSRVALFNAQSVGTWYQYGGYRGLLKSDILCVPAGGTTNIGDTMTIDGNTWTVMGTIGGASPAFIALARAT